MRKKVNETLARQLAVYKRYLDKKFRILPVFTVGQMIYVNWPPLTIFSEDRQTSAKYNKLLQRTAGRFNVLKVRDHVLMINENGITNTFLIIRATSVGSQHHQRLFKSKKHRRPTTN